MRGKNSSRRSFLKGTASAALGGAALSFVGRPSLAADLKTVRFSEAVHNLGYINLYVGMHSDIFKKNGLDMQVSAAGGDTQTFAAVLGGSADFAIGDATMAVISRENGGPGVVVGTVVQRAHYFAVSKTVEPFADPKMFKGKRIATSPEPNTNFSVTKRLIESNGMKLGEDATIVPVSPGTEIAAMLAGQADIAIAYQPGVSQAVAQGAKIVFDFSNYVGPFCNTGIMVLPDDHPRKTPTWCRPSSRPSRKPDAKLTGIRPMRSRWRGWSFPICRATSWTPPSTPRSHTKFRLRPL